MLTPVCRRLWAQFFLRGTSLAQLSEEYDLVKQNIDSIAGALETKRSSMPDMRARVEEAQKKVDSVQAGVALERRLVGVQAESAWSMVIGKEAERDEATTGLETKRKKARKVQARLEKAQGEEAALKEELNALEAETTEIKEAMRPAQDELKEATQALKNARVELRGADVSQLVLTALAPAAARVLISIVISLA